MSYTVTKENDFGYPIGESIDDVVSISMIFILVF